MENKNRKNNHKREIIEFNYDSSSNGSEDIQINSNKSNGEMNLDENDSNEERFSDSMENKNHKNNQKREIIEFTRE
jgi:hypothetical protein